MEVTSSTTRQRLHQKGKTSLPGHTRAKCTQVIFSQKHTHTHRQGKGESYQRNAEGEQRVQIYLHPAILNRWAYIAPISPMPITPMVAFSLLRTIARPSSFESSVNASRLLCLFFLLPAPSFSRSCHEEEFFACFNVRVHRCVHRPVPAIFCPPFRSHVPRLIRSRETPS